eukprot:1156013-Pelagomonas_calceolata.AAC.7
MLPGTSTGRFEVAVMLACHTAENETASPFGAAKSMPSLQALAHSPTPGPRRWLPVSHIWEPEAHAVLLKA